MIEFRYILFHFLLIIVICVFSNKISKSDYKKYWNIALIPIIFFTIEEGLRWGREMDWCVYYRVYDDIKKGIDTGHEWFFQKMWYIISCIKTPYSLLVAFCSFFYITSLFYVIKPYKELVCYAVPLVVLMNAYSATNLIRWFLALSFLSLAMRDLINLHKLRSLLFLLLACFTHYGIFLLFPIILLIFRIKNELLSPKFVIVISFLLCIFFNQSLLRHFTFIFDLFSGVSRFEHYQNDKVGWLIGTASVISGNISPIQSVVKLIPIWIMFGYGHKYITSIKKYRSNDSIYILLYNLSLVGILLNSIASGLELLGRYTYFFNVFICLLSSAGVIFLLQNKRKNILDLIFLFIVFVYFIDKIFDFCMPLYDDIHLMQYVWDMQTDPSILFYEYWIVK